MPIKFDEKGAVKRPGMKISFDKSMMINFAACAKSVKYFAENYYYVVHPISGKQLIELRSYQIRMLEEFQNNNKVILLAPRQVGKCLSSDVNITVRNDITGEIQEIPIGEFFDNL